MISLAVFQKPATMTDLKYTILYYTYIPITSAQTTTDSYHLLPHHSPHA